MTDVAAYLRISADPYGEERGIDRQREDAEQIAARNGWTISEFYVDNDFSAFKRSVVRPAFQKMLIDLTERRVEGLVTWDLDRLTRQPIEMERLIHLHEDVGGFCAADSTKQYDLGNADEQMMLRFKINFAHASSQATGRRTRRMHLGLARSGKPVGGTRPFGWQSDKTTLDLAESALIREAARDVLRGVGLHTIATRWTEAGVTTPRGNRWTNTTLRRMLLNPRLAGWRTHRGEQVVVDGQPVRGLWEAVMEPGEHEALVATFSERKQARGRDEARRYLLTGVVRCWSCRALLHGAVWSRNRDTFYYRCPSVGGGGCGKTNVIGNRVDEQVEAALLRVMAQERVEVEDEPWSREDELADVEARLDELWTAYRSGAVKGSRAFSMISEMEDEVDALRDERARHLRASMREAGPSDVDLVASWPGLPVEQRRHLVTTHVDAVWILPAAGRGGRWNPDRVRVDWRTRA